MELISLKEKEKWNNLVMEFPQWDIYYLNEYAHSLQLHGDGIPYLIYHEKDGARLCYVMMQNDISEFAPLSGVIPAQNITIGQHHMGMAVR